MLESRDNYRVAWCEDRPIGNAGIARLQIVADLLGDGWEIGEWILGGDYSWHDPPLQELDRLRRRADELLQGAAWDRRKRARRGESSRCREKRFAAGELPRKVNGVALCRPSVEPPRQRSCLPPNHRAEPSPGEDQDEEADGSASAYDGQDARHTQEENPHEPCFYPDPG